MNKIVLLALFVLNFACSSTQNLILEPVSSGEVHYNIDLDFIPSAKQLEESFGNEAILKFDKNFIRFQKVSDTPGEEFYISNLQTGEKTAYVEFLDHKFAIIEDTAMLPSVGEFNFKNDFKDIAGYKCQKATAPFGQKTMTVYLTKELGVSYVPYGNFEGFALGYELEFPYGKVSYLADKVSIKNMDNENIAPPTDYKKVSVKEFQMEMRNITNRVPTGSLAKNFIKEDINGEEIELKKLQGSVVVINFWFIGCAPCVAEMPDLNDLKAKYQNEDVVFLAITFDNHQKVNNFLEEQPFDFNIIADAQDVIRDYEIMVFPTTIILDENGKIVNSKAGGSSNIKQELSSIIDEALKN